MVAESFMLFSLYIWSYSLSLTTAGIEHGFGNDDHHSNKTNERNIHKCDLCDNAFLRQSSMRQHVKTIHSGENHTNATNAIMLPCRPEVWVTIWKHTVDKNQTNVSNVIMHPRRQAVWVNIWKYTLEKSLTLAASVTMHPFMHTLWKHIWKNTVWRSQNFAISLTMQPLWKAILGSI